MISHRTVLEWRLGVARRVATGQQQDVALPQRDLEVLGQADEELRAGA